MSDVNVPSFIDFSSLLAPWTFTASATELGLRAHLEQFTARLAANRFQLAVVGQFKRGKSSLLNALLDVDVLPTGVVPLTAIPTFIVHGSRPALAAARYADGRSTGWSGGVEGLRSRIALLTTETGNPHNEKQVARVEIALHMGFTGVETQSAG